MAFHAISPLVDLYDGCRVSVKIGRHSLLLVQCDGEVSIFDNRCPHMDAPLATGALTSGSIVCRAHGIAFDLTTGRAAGPLADVLDCLNFYPVVYQGSFVGVEL